MSSALFSIEFHNDKGCKQLGHTCNNMAKEQCCSDGATKYFAADFDEGSSDTCTDQIKIYPGDGSNPCGGLPIDQETYPKCAKSTSRNVHGAKVFIVIRPGSKRRDVPVNNTVVVPDESFYQNGTTRYIVKRESPEGHAFMLLEKDEDRINHLVTFGRSVEVQQKKCKTRREWES